MIDRRGFVKTVAATALAASLGVPEASADMPELSGAPALGRRALLLDCGRKSFSVGWVERLVAYMSAIGLNELQLHFAENNRLGIASERHREYDQGGSGAQQWTKQTVRDIVSFANGHGVAVTPELDMPGHMGWLLAKRPEFELKNTNSAIDIASDAALRFLDDVVDEYAELFAGCAHWNLGFDEIFRPEAPGDGAARLASAARDRFGPEANEHDLVTDTANRYARRLADRGFRVGVWNDTLLKGAVTRLDQQVTVNYWTRWNDGYRPVADILAAGYSVMNYNDYFLYYALAPWYAHPTVENVLGRWRPEVFSPSLGIAPGRIGQIAEGGASVQGLFPDPQFQVVGPGAAIEGAAFSIWADYPEREGEDQIFASVKEPLAAFALQSWNPGAKPTAGRVREIAAQAGSG
ncbi:MAG: family 20 glycosylhydrolase [Segniliparus sp.]|uniref:family 20 glycosylhydrolase n=1 Tax=Segniliparus sp. TaxID=2804064 RepID=UPI003F2B9E3B